MMRISVVQSSSQAVTLRLEGEVKGGWVAELRQSCEGALSEGTELVLDLAGVSYIDRDGIALFMRHGSFSSEPHPKTSGSVSNCFA